MYVLIYLYVKYRIQTALVIIKYINIYKYIIVLTEISQIANLFS